MQLEIYTGLEQEALTFTMVFCREGLSADEVETVMQLGLGKALNVQAQLYRSSMTPKDQSHLAAARESNWERVKQLSPISPWGCLSAAVHEFTQKKYVKVMQVTFILLSKEMHVLCT